MPDIAKIYNSDKRALAEVDRLLQKEGIRRDRNLDYICGIYDDDFRLIATGSAFRNTLRCFAVSEEHQGEGLLNTVITHLMDYQHSRGYTTLFLYTKCSTERFFRDLGFYEVAKVENELVFMENVRHGFDSTLERFQRETTLPGGEKGTASVVMNANPFTLGHQYLVERAASENELLHLFLLSEDAGPIPFDVRKKLVLEGTAHLKNIVYHDSGPYIISSATFPSYFQKDEAAVSRGHALLDITIFRKIAKALGITRRYVGEEPFSEVTNIYNQVMREELPKAGIECIVVPRRLREGTAISASAVRTLLKQENFAQLKGLVPPSTLAFFQGPEGTAVLERIKAVENVVHH